MNRKIRLTGRAYQKYTGEFCGEQFENGVSVNAIGRNECNRIAAIIGAVDAETGEDVLLSSKADAQRAAERQKLRYQIDNGQKEVSLKSNFKPKTEKSNSRFDFTVESLGEVADQGGIQGLREFCKPYDVTGRSISDIIEKMMALKASVPVSMQEPEAEEVNPEGSDVIETGDDSADQHKDDVGV